MERVTLADLDLLVERIKEMAQPLLEHFGYASLDDVPWECPHCLSAVKPVKRWLAEDDFVDVCPICSEVI